MKKGSFRKIFGIVLVSAIYSICHTGSSKAGNLAEQGEGIRPLITTAELVTGSNRFAFGLMKANRLLDKAKVIVRLYRLEGDKGYLAAEVNAPYNSIQSVNREDSVHLHADGTRHLHTFDNGVQGLYITRLAFSKAGIWGAELVVREDSAPAETVRLSLRVLDRAPTPSVGASAPRSHNMIAADVKNLQAIDTSPSPDPRLHRVRIGDAIAQGKLQLIVFATPEFCTTRMCGPVVDIVRGLLPSYGDRFVFTHQEIWQDFATKKLFPTVKEWRLSSEPWIFVVDGKGIIRAKFEGLVTEDELKEALQQVLASNSDHRP